MRYLDGEIDESVKGTINCQRHNGEVKALGFCLDSFIEATALELQDSPCFQCPQGQAEREKFAGGPVAPLPKGWSRHADEVRRNMQIAAGRHFAKRGPTYKTEKKSTKKKSRQAKT